jgi:hypothetical protein
VSSAAPLLDAFRRGEVSRDIRLLAASGVLAPRAHEQIAILVLLADDRDPEIRSTALATIDRVPVDSLCAYLARTDVPVGVREFFGDRGVFPAEIPALSDDLPLIDVAPPEGDAAYQQQEPGDTAGEMLQQRLSKMGFTERMKAAMRGTREMRGILIRDPNKAIAAAVLSSPKLTESEVESYAKMSSVSEDVLRTIGTTRSWLKNYGIVAALTRNPKTPLGISLNLLQRLTDRDLASLSSSRNVPEPLRAAARRKTVFGAQR